MTKKKNTSQSPGNKKQTQTSGLLILVAAILIFVFSRLTGIDLLNLDAPVPTAVATTAPAEQVPMDVGTAPISVIFSAPTGSRDVSTYINGPDTVLADAIRQARRTVDVAAYELNSPAIADALIDRHRNGVRVRIVTDNDAGLNVALYEQYLAAPANRKEDLLDEMKKNPSDTLLDELYDAGIPIVDDARSGLMHNKFVIIDGAEVWMGSMNMTLNDAYRNNNNLNHVRSARVAANYQAEFNEMFEERSFGPRSPRNTPYPQVTVNNVLVEVYFAPEDNVMPQIVSEINAAQEEIRFMAFSFTEDSMGQAMLERAAAGVEVSGIFETTGSETAFSELTPLFCAGLDVRQDGNPFILHHKVIVIDRQTVVTGSFNFSSNATNTNDENLLIIHDPALAQQYLVEFEQRFAQANPPTRIQCN